MKYYIELKNINKVKHLLINKFRTKEDKWCCHKIIRDINKLPLHIIKFLEDNNLKICISNKPIYNETDFEFKSHYNYKYKIIYLFTNNLLEFKKYRNYSLVHHEIGHAIDNVMAEVGGYFKVIYLSHAKLSYNYQQKALDKYAAESPHEYFAQGFMSYFQNKYDKYKFQTYFEHTKEELIRDKRLFDYINKLVYIK